MCSSDLVDLLLTAAGRNSLSSAQVHRDIYIDIPALGLVSVVGGGDDFPLGQDPLPTEPWTPGDLDVNVIFYNGDSSDFG